MAELPNGSLAPAYTFNSASVLKGAELLGKHIGMFKDRLEVTGKGGGPIETVDMTPTEQARRIAFALTRGTKEQAVTH
jgi:phage terminase small subunit